MSRNVSTETGWSNKENKKAKKKGEGGAHACCTHETEEEGHAIMPSMSPLLPCLSMPTPPFKGPPPTLLTSWPKRVERSYVSPGKRMTPIFGRLFRWHFRHAGGGTSSRLPPAVHGFARHAEVRLTIISFVSHFHLLDEKVILASISSTFDRFSLLQVNCSLLHCKLRGLDDMFLNYVSYKYSL